MMTLIRQRYAKACPPLPSRNISYVPRLKFLPMVYVISPTFLELNFYPWCTSICLVASATGIMEMLAEYVVLCCVSTDHLFVGYSTLLHSERPKLHAILVFLSAIGLNTAL